ncbi:helix-turn-helix domain-containing protein [Sphaerisporangium sp. NPDC049002]|uniref:ATP-binding protein n=1 Tax=Sphaerisporangium sp. NPDC049002 TaxID=3155392 RepID=UPI003400821A
MLRHHRHAARLTLEQLAEASGVSARTLSDMERGRSTGPQHRTVTALAQALSLGEDDRTQLIDLAREGRLRDHWTRPTGLCEPPRTVDDFTGRAGELAWVEDFVRAGDTPGAAGVALITGSAGLGKTTFAVRAAHVLRPNFPDGVFFVDLFGMSPRPVSAYDALTQLLRALGTADRHMPHDPLERASLYRSLLRERRALVVLDNAGSEEQIRPVLPGSGRSRAFATSRRLLAGLEGVHRLSLGPLPPVEAAELLTGILGKRGYSDGGAAISELAQLCGGLPLALRIVGNRLVSRPGWHAADFVGRLADEERRLDQLRAGDLKIATAFGMSYEQLAVPARRVFRRLALVPGRDFDAALAAVLGGVSVEDAWDALDELVDLGLLEDGASGRYRFHDLVRLFARDRLHAEETGAGRDALAETMTSWLLRMATMAGRWFGPQPDRPGRSDADLEDFASAEEAEHWLRVNADNWLGALRYASGAARHLDVLDCAESMHWFSDRWIHGPHWREVFTLGAEAAAALGDTPQHATQLNYLAWVHLVPPVDLEATMRYAAEALDLAIRSGATAQIAWAHQYAGTALLHLGRTGEAFDSLTKASEMFKADADIDAYCQSLSNLGDCLVSDGRHEAALEHLLMVRALLDDEDSGMSPDIVSLTRPQVLARVGQCLGRLGRRAEAITTLTEAIALMEPFQMFGSQARALETLAAVLAEDGRTEESSQAYARAAEAFEAIGDAGPAGRCRDLADALR